jgi:hypothetical protein
MMYCPAKERPKGMLMYDCCGSMRRGASVPAMCTINMSMVNLVRRGSRKHKPITISQMPR